MVLNKNLKKRAAEAYEFWKALTGKDITFDMWQKLLVVNATHDLLKQKELTECYAEEKGSESSTKSN